MAQTFDNLMEDFKRSAARVKDDPDAVPFVMETYRVLLNHKAQTPDNRQELAGVLLDVGSSILMRIANPSYTENFIGTSEKLDALVKTLTWERTLDCATPVFATTMADAALKLSAKGEQLPSSPQMSSFTKEYARNCQAELLRLTRLASGLADVFAQAIESRTISVETQKPLTASKPLQLRTGGQTA